jgi:hypothetical protein
MRYHPLSVSAIALILTACSSSSLPEDIVGKAGTCAVVAASAAREAMKDPEASLPVDQQSQIIHYALIAGATDPKFSSDIANAVIRQMQMVQDTMGEGDWKKLVEPCKQAFPEAELTHPAVLTEDPAKAKLICYSLGGFMSRALAAHEESYNEEVDQYNGMTDTIMPDLQPADAPKLEEGKRPKIDTGPSIAEAAKLGPPSKILATCVERFPPKEVKLPDQPNPS